MFLQMRENFGTLQMFVQVCCSFCGCVSLMQMRPPDARIQCCCSYKCKHGSNGYAQVCRKTWHNHQRLVAACELHSYVRRSMKRQRATHESDITQSPQSARNVICTCKICGGRHWRSRNIVAKHMRQQLVRQRMYNFPPCLLRIPSVAEEVGKIISHE